MSSADRLRDNVSKDALTENGADSNGLKHKVAQVSQFLMTRKSMSDYLFAYPPIEQQEVFFILC